MQYLLVGIGGALGSATRYGLGKMISGKVNTKYPVATFIINITGSILLGVVSSLGLNTNLFLLLADGFLGAYTTFSTFMYEGFNLIKGNEKLNAFLYIISSIVFGVIGFQAGYLITRLITLKTP